MNEMIPSQKAKRVIAVLSVVSLLFAFLIGRWTYSGAAQMFTGNGQDVGESGVDSVAEAVEEGIPVASVQNAATRLLDLERRIASCRSEGDFLSAIESIQADTGKTEKTRFFSTSFFCLVGT